MLVCLFCKKKTAYEMRISDWSSDVCSADLTVVLLDRDRRELVLLDDTEANAGVGLDFLLEVVGDGLIALGRDHRERVDLEAPQPSTLRVAAQTPAATDGLPASPPRAGFTHGANPAHVGIVHATFQRERGTDNREHPL